MLTVSEIRKLIKAHNVLTKITIPKGATRNDLIKLVEKKGYTVDHENKKISRSVDGKPETITLKGAEVIGKPKEKTALQKQKAAEKKEEKAIAQKKKERELKKEAVKKATKDMVPKTQPPKKIGAKPVPQKKPAKKEDEVRPTSKPGRPRVDPSKITVIEPKKKTEKKEKKKYDTEGAKKIGEAIKAKKAAKEEPEKKIRKGTVRERKSLATLKEKWSTGAKLTFKWSPEQVKEIEDILNNRDGIEAQGYEQKESGSKWVFHFTKNGKQEKLVVKRPDPRPLKEIKELKEKN